MGSAGAVVNMSHVFSVFELGSRNVSLLAQCAENRITRFSTGKCFLSITAVTVITILGKLGDIDVAFVAFEGGRLVDREF